MDPTDADPVPPSTNERQYRWRRNITLALIVAVLAFGAVTAVGIVSVPWPQDVVRMRTLRRDMAAIRLPPGLKKDSSKTVWSKKPSMEESWTQLSYTVTHTGKRPLQPLRNSMFQAFAKSGWNLHPVYCSTGTTRLFESDVERSEQISITAWRQRNGLVDWTEEAAASILVEKDAVRVVVTLAAPPKLSRGSATSIPIPGLTPTCG
jgi:hypothetical protein